VRFAELSTVLASANPTPLPIRHIQNRLRESLGGLLRQVVADPAANGSMLLLTRELIGISFRGRVRRAVGVAF